jgi:hypothetical protein
VPGFSSSPDSPGYQASCRAARLIMGVPKAHDQEDADRHQSPPHGLAGKGSYRLLHRRFDALHRRDAGPAQPRAALRHRL